MADVEWTMKVDDVFGGNSSNGTNHADCVGSRVVEEHSALLKRLGGLNFTAEFFHKFVTFCARLNSLFLKICTFGSVRATSCRRQAVAVGIVVVI